MADQQKPEEKKPDQKPEDKKPTAEELAAQLAAANAELEKFRSKDYNFKRLRDMTEAEKEKLTERDRELMMRAEKLEDDQRKFNDDRLNFHRNTAIERLAGGDAEMKKSIEGAYQEFVGDAQDVASVEARVLKAYRLVKGASAPINHAAASLAPGGAAPEKPKDTGYAETDEGKALAGALQLGLAKKKQ